MYIPSNCVRGALESFSNVTRQKSCNAHIQENTKLFCNGDTIAGLNKPMLMKSLYQLLKCLKINTEVMSDPVWMTTDQFKYPSLAGEDRDVIQNPFGAGKEQKIV